MKQAHVDLSFAAVALELPLEDFAVRYIGPALAWLKANAVKDYQGDILMRIEVCEMPQGNRDG